MIVTCSMGMHRRDVTLLLWVELVAGLLCNSIYSSGGAISNTSYKHESVEHVFGELFKIPSILYSVQSII